MTNQFASGYALLIAVDENQMPGYALPAVAKDAAALQAVLVHPERCAYPEEHVRVLRGAAASRDGILDGLSWLEERLRLHEGGETTAIVYYTGHGARNTADDSYYILPYDFGLPAEEKAIAASDLATAVSIIRPQRLLVILDCCHAAGLGIKGDDPLEERGLRHAAAPADSESISALALGRGRAVLSSSTGEEQSYVRKDRSMSVFTYHLIEALSGHGTAVSGATEVLVSDVMGYVTRTVPQTTMNDYGLPQTPYFQMSGENFPVALLLGGEGLAKGRPAPAPETLAYWPPMPAQQPAGLAIAGAVHTGGGDFVGGSKTVGGDVISGNQYNLSGNFTGSILNIDAQMSGIIQRVDGAPGAEMAGRAELLQLVASLQAALEQLPPGERERADGLLHRLTGLMTELDRGDREMILLLGESLLRAAEPFEALGATIPDLVDKIVATARQFAR